MIALLMLLACQSGKSPEAGLTPEPVLPPSTVAAPVHQQAELSPGDVPIDPDVYREMLMNRDTDDDGVVDFYDNCPLHPNPDQANADDDSAGDVCDACPREVGGYELGCPVAVGPREQISRDAWRALHPGADWDNDGVPMPQDNCPLSRNPDQADADDDGWGDVCDRCRNEPAVETVDGCPYGERWAVSVAIEADPVAFCTETCEVLETCNEITMRWPGRTAQLVRSQCETACQEDASTRDQIIELGRSRKVITTGCELGPELAKTFRVWTLFGCDQLYCPKLSARCNTQYAAMGDPPTACIDSCLAFGDYNPGYSSTPPTGVTCLIERAESNLGAKTCTEATPETTSCPRG